jgi:Ni,Fe-hydrogenase III large subunit/Ni,Fe-hydrogenase III component G
MTEVETAAATLFALLSNRGAQLNIPVDRQVQVQIRSDALFRELAEQLAAERYYLVTVVANDERELEDRRYKIYYVFSHPSVDLFVTIEYLLVHGSVSYCSIWDHFPAVDPFEREMRDMVGLCPAAEEDPATAPRIVPRGSWLHDAYPPDLYPLRRRHTAAQLREHVAAEARDRSPAPTGPTAQRAASKPASEPIGMTFPVGPIHAGIIESGQFWFTTAGEAIEDLHLRLGYTHRGVERMFQSYVNLIDGWRLAEQVSGDTSFAHSLAYCRAAEVLTETTVPPAAEVLRAMFLELERIHNHVGDVAGLAEDIGMDQFAAEFAVIREEVLRLNKRLTGHRYLRAVNRIGGVRVAGSLDPADITGVLGKLIGTFEGLAASLTARSGFRERTLQVGILTGDDALALGVTGLAARASGIPRDSRLGHPVGAYRDAGHILRASQPVLGGTRVATTGDVFARTLVRAREVLVCRRLIGWLAGQWSQLAETDRARLVAEPQILPENNYTSAIGYAEGCRGDVVYWLMQDKMNGIYRCKVRDPSMLNWPALRACALPRTIDGTPTETLIADFPLLNKSFSLSCAGNDL